MITDVELDVEEQKLGLNAFATMATNGDKILIDCDNCEADDFRIFAAALIADLIEEQIRSGHDTYEEVNSTLQEICQMALERVDKEIRCK